MEIAATTRWAGHPPDADRLRRLLDLGLAGLVVHESIRERGLAELRALVPRRFLRAFHLFAPLPDRLEEGPFPFRLGSLSAGERQDAIAQGQRTIEAADADDVRLVVVPPVDLEDPDRDRVQPVFERGGPAHAWEALWRRKAEAAARQLDSYLMTLSRLVDHAARYS